ncbi:MAG: Crp/Fnr family transcriptional regulator [Lachnospiraceae bacterium]
MNLEEKYKILKTNYLFHQVNMDEFKGMIACLDAKEKTFKKNEFILRVGDPISFVGIVLKGSIKIIKEDIEGNQQVIAKLVEGELFGETFACADISRSPVAIQGTQECEILLLDYGKIIHTCSSTCISHQKLVENMLKILAMKNLYLNQKIDIISKRTLREKIISYFEYERKGRSTFSISFNREELANYLCADRSALSNELSKMQKEGIIRYQKNNFEILKCN